MQLHWKIIIGLVLGTIYGIASAVNGWSDFTSDFISPFGTIFLNLLKLIAVPLVVSSLITGVASLSDTTKLSRIGWKTIALYISTTAVAVSIGLILVNVLQPGSLVPDNFQETLSEEYRNTAATKQDLASSVQNNRGPLQPLVDMVPSNMFSAASNNSNMLQIVFISIIFGIALIGIDRKFSQPVLAFLEGINQMIIKLVEMIMYFAPYGVFALIAKTISSVSGDVSQIGSILSALLFYMGVVVLGLFIHMGITYLTILKMFTNMDLKHFFKSMAPVQLLAFSTSSSGATLPVTMKRCEKDLGVSEEISSFVLPLGATINMDGTALYQGVAAVFIAQAIGMDLTFANQFTIVATAVLASIGTAAVPGAGIIMLVIILEAINVPSQGIALILGVDRILDMIRTATNVTGDATIACAMDSLEK
ncbi:dicarboxylate/amino acid:cation symporter [Candidatus Marinimicrobia bacterium]|jgi:Na+/H+-dicarboxylate symporter|nr:dicarboxylate/amino acid:cation symporter [Candidatus Neomarinimicrobiota bacterium]MDB3887617.1 dicarboxylate/amino acid:cation symporter [Candidatus Neomarinimicrobiota bacterium]MDC0594142.1 dicarboxylate/amino acid:cation symporter [Candidatus Neomarinimicrobiota bacterium]MDC0878016.1 dicarboxylate/amino acid:cation symporter [Candidatus Neomarinimicrobiota bacterium]MDC1000707.1 dicarboxylate/amino acid:cation symporter [Candidatus Neomarinimicrobiota bacterium]|tara:strand:+ start:720 stop:1982 length:1263 start_codon:yes stop_codon:yes gene_type:complete